MVWVGSRRKVLAAVATLCAASTSARVALAGKFEILGGAVGTEVGGVVSSGTPLVSGAMQNGDRAPTRELVVFTRDLAPGSILVKTSERKLYYVMPDGKALRYSVGVGRAGFAWSGRNQISRKAEWPDWRPPPVMIAREAKRGNYLPDMMPGGEHNPLGARALYIGSTEFRIHGTTQPWSIGRAVSSGCIRMLNEDVIDLYNRVAIGAAVVVES
jgi:lipoprotein-anchoring transpeptidase ErfK/SrfK